MSSRRVIKKLFFLPLLLILLFWTTEADAQENDSLRHSWLRVITNLEQYYLVIDNDYSTPHLVTRSDSIQVDPGLRKITVVWKKIRDFSFRVNLQPNHTHVESITFASFPDKPRTSYKIINNEPNLVIDTDTNSSIYLDGKYLGKQRAELIVEGEKHDLVIKHPNYGQLRKTISTSMYETKYVSRYNKNPSKLPLAAKFIPGAEFIATKRYGRALITYVLLGALTTNLIVQNSLYLEKDAEFKNLYELYQNAGTSEDAIDYRLNTLSVQRELESISRNYNITFALTGTFYLLSTLDSIRKPKSGYQHLSKNRFPELSISYSSATSYSTPMLSLKFSID